MRYYLDTEFHEYHKQPKIAGIKIEKPIPTIDLISIGIVSEDYPEAVIEQNHPYDKNAITAGKMVMKDREYYAICKEFNVKDAWYSNQGTKEKPDYWLRKNVLFPIYKEMLTTYHEAIPFVEAKKIKVNDIGQHNLNQFKALVNYFGKTKKQIAEEIHAFIYEGYLKETGLSYPEAFNYSHPDYDPQFYAYYADYDWVVFCQLFGKMMDLPRGFPMYCRDLKQLQDTKDFERAELCRKDPVRNKVETVEKLRDYPKQENEHNALDDAKWNKKLHEFLNTL